MMKLRDALEDSEDQLNLTDDSIWSYVANVIVSEGVQWYFTATPDVTPSSVSKSTSKLDQRLFMHMATVLP